MFESFQCLAPGAPLFPLLISFIPFTYLYNQSKVSFYFQCTSHVYMSVSLFMVTALLTLLLLLTNTLPVSLRKGRVLFGFEFQSIGHHSKAAWWRELEEAEMMSVTLSLLSSFYAVQSFRPWNGALVFRMSLPTSVNLISIISHRHGRKLASFGSFKMLTSHQSIFLYFSVTFLFSTPSYFQSQVKSIRPDFRLFAYI